MSVPAPRSPSELATLVARLFFERQMSKVEIGQHLGISRFRVARLIEGALADGLVRIEYRDVPTEDRGLATTLEGRYGLDLCAVASDPWGAPRLAAAVLDGLIGADDVIGIAWGSTLAAVIHELPARADPSLEVVQLAGSSTRVERDRDAADVSRALADRLGGTHRAIFAPAFVESASLRTALCRQPEIASTIDRFRALTLAVVGIGAMPAGDGNASSSLLRSGVLDDDTVARLAALGVVGDLVVHPFDGGGRFVAPELADRAVAIGVDELRAVRRVMAVAAGVEKAAAIRGALASGLVNMLVTDAATARAVAAVV